SMTVAVGPFMGSSITPFEEMDLRWYFGLDLPGVPGLASSFGAMCARLQQKKRDSKERPSADAPWTRIMKCRPAAASRCNSTTEDAIIEYLDTHRRAARMR